jgi:hypothetical protein
MAFISASIWGGMAVFERVMILFQPANVLMGIIPGMIGTVIPMDAIRIIGRIQLRIED